LTFFFSQNNQNEKMPIAQKALEVVLGTFSGKQTGKTNLAIIVRNLLKIVIGKGVNEMSAEQTLKCSSIFLVPLRNCVFFKNFRLFAKKFLNLEFHLFLVSWRMSWLGLSQLLGIPGLIYLFQLLKVCSRKHALLTINDLESASSLFSSAFFLFSVGKTQSPEIHESMILYLSRFY